MHFDAPCATGIAKQMAIVVPVRIVDEDRAMIDSSLGDVQGDTGKFEA